jgi:hypothetical protein
LTFLFIYPTYKPMTTAQQFNQWSIFSQLLDNMYGRVTPIRAVVAQKVLTSPIFRSLNLTTSPRILTSLGKIPF